MLRIKLAKYQQKIMYGRKHYTCKMCKSIESFIKNIPCFRKKNRPMENVERVMKMVGISKANRNCDITKKI